MSQQPRTQVEDHIAALRTDIVRTLCELLQVDEPQAAVIAARLISSMRERFGGERLYIGVRNGTDRDAVLRDWRGNNAEEVCAAHRISLRTLYRIIKEGRRAGLAVAEPAQRA